MLALHVAEGGWVTLLQLPQLTPPFAFYPPKPSHFPSALSAHILYKVFNRNWTGKLNVSTPIKKEKEKHPNQKRLNRKITVVITFSLCETAGQECAGSSLHQVSILWNFGVVLSAYVLTQANGEDHSQQLWKKKHSSQPFPACDIMSMFTWTQNVHSYTLGSFLDSQT